MERIGGIRSFGAEVVQSGMYETRPIPDAPPPFHHAPAPGASMCGVPLRSRSMSAVFLTNAVSLFLLFTPKPRAECSERRGPPPGTVPALGGVAGHMMIWGWKGAAHRR